MTRLLTAVLAIVFLAVWCAIFVIARRAVVAEIRTAPAADAR